MLEWLVANVQGFRDKKSAKAFASSALALGLIKHGYTQQKIFKKNFFLFFFSGKHQLLQREVLLHF